MNFINTDSHVHKWLKKFQQPGGLSTDIPALFVVQSLFRSFPFLYEHFFSIFLTKKSKG
jgi:hypothetical protein